MKAYIITTGAIFGLLAIVHVLRIFMENRELARDPFYVLITIALAVIAIWAWYVLRRSKS